MFVCCVCCVLSDRGLCDELITRPGEYCRLWRVVVCDQETSWYEEAIARAGLQSRKNSIILNDQIIRILKHKISLFWKHINIICCSPSWKGVLRPT
jgi:hypothetical protein